MSRCTLDPAALTRISCTGLSPSMAGFPKTVLLSSSVTYAVRTPRCTHHGLGSARFARRYFGHRCFFLFLRLLRCFSSPGSPPYVMDWRTDTPQLFAAYHVFHRLLVPRHPPCALLRFIFLPISRRSAPVHSVAPAHGSFSVFLGCLVDQ